jgi:hypothetical protein
MSDFIKIRPVGAEVFHADGRTDMKLFGLLRMWLKCTSERCVLDVQPGDARSNRWASEDRMLDPVGPLVQ